MKVIAGIATMGERTTDLSVHLIRKQVDAIRVIENVSRIEAVRSWWEFGLEADILVCSGADLLVCSDVVELVVGLLKDWNCDRLVGKCLSKFRGLTVGGISVYNTRCLPRLLEELPKFRNSLRPESDTATNVLGKEAVKVEITTALHEFELDYYEIYTRYMYQKVKHQDEMEYRLSRFKRQAEEDDDYKAVVQALTGQKFSMGKKEPITDFNSIITKYSL